MMSTVDHYKVLGLPKDATIEEIKRRFIQLSKEFHPDISKTANTHEKFAQISEAYRTLSSNKRRVEYDATVAARKSPYGEVNHSGTPVAGPHSLPQRTRLDWYKKHHSDAYRNPLEERDFALKRKEVAAQKSYNQKVARVTKLLLLSAFIVLAVALDRHKNVEHKE